MRIIVHTGAHHTDEDRLLKCLLRNQEEFSERGIAVPGPGKYRTLLKESFNAMEASQASGQSRDILIDAILDESQADRMILSNAHFFGSQRFSVADGKFYPLAVQRMQQMTELFKGDTVEMAIGLRNPASFLPAVLERVGNAKRDEILGALDPYRLRWSDLLVQLRAALPDMPILLWCNEDTPLIWAQIIREMAGLPAGQKIIGGFDLLSDIMSKDGMRRFRAYLKEHPNMSELQKRRVIAAFLDKFAIEEELEEELDLPGWTVELVEEMTVLYDDDMLRIQQIPGVQIISP